MFEETFIWASILVWLWVFQFPKAQNPLEEMPLWTKALWMKQENRRKANQYSSIIHVTWSPPSFDILFLQFTKCQRVKSCPLHIRPKKNAKHKSHGKIKCIAHKKSRLIFLIKIEKKETKRTFHKVRYKKMWADCLLKNDVWKHIQWDDIA